MSDLRDDIRVILAQNIRTARETLRLTQSALAESAHVSLPYIVDIERRRTWVSDKTLSNIAYALNMEAYELLMPARTRELGGNSALLPRIAELIEAKKTELKNNSDRVMDELARDVIKLFSDS